MNGQPIPLPHGVAAARDHSGMGGRLFGEVAERAQRARERLRQFLGRDRLSLSEPARRAGRRGGCEGHGAAHRPGGEVADHDAGGRRVAAGRQGRRSAALRGPAKTTSPGSTCRSTTARRGSRRASPANRRAITWRRFEFEFNATKPQSYLILSRATDTQGQHAAGGVAVESVRIPVESVRLGSHRSQMMQGATVPGFQAFQGLVRCGSGACELRSRCAQTLPAGPGADVLKSRCVSCHEADIITSQKLSLTGWTNSVDKMVRWGAQITPEERDVLQPYLAQHFAPRPVASHACHRSRARPPTRGSASPAMKPISSSSRSSPPRAGRGRSKR